MTRNEAIEAIEEVVDAHDGEFSARLYFDYGADPETNLVDRGPQRWKAGRLLCHWLCSSEEFFQVRVKIAGLRESIQSLDLVKRVHVENFNDEFLSEMSRVGLHGERWEIEFH